MSTPSSGDYADAADLRAALRRFLRRSEEVARQNDLTPRQYLLLLLVRAAQDAPAKATVTDLVDRLALTQSTVTELVQRAEEAGLIAREQSPIDGRVVHLSLTPTGAERLERAFTELGPERDALRSVIRHGD